MNSLNTYTIQDKVYTRHCQKLNKDHTHWVVFQVVQAELWSEVEVYLHHEASSDFVLVREICSAA